MKNLKITVVVVRSDGSRKAFVHHITETFYNSTMNMQSLLRSVRNWLDINDNATAYIESTSTVIEDD